MHSALAFSPSLMRLANNVIGHQCLQRLARAPALKRQFTAPVTTSILPEEP
jgi:hypothetical protein